MKAERLKEIRERCEAATVPPWTLFAKGETIEVDYDGDPDAPIIKWTGFDGSYLNRKGDRANANFIAHAREDIPVLIAEIERLSSQAPLQVSDELVELCARALWESEEYNRPWDDAHPEDAGYRRNDARVVLEAALGTPRGEEGSHDVSS